MQDTLGSKGKHTNNVFSESDAFDRRRIFGTATHAVSSRLVRQWNFMKLEPIYIYLQCEISTYLSWLILTQASLSALPLTRNPQAEAKMDALGTMGTDCRLAKAKGLPKDLPLWPSGSSFWLGTGGATTGLGSRPWVPWTRRCSRQNIQEQNRKEQKVCKTTYAHNRYIYISLNIYIYIYK